MTSTKGFQNGLPPSIPNARIAYAMSGGALVLASRDRVDYSVTKGGLRLWAVLFVFIVLCSSIYTIISQDMVDIAMDLDDDGDLDDDMDDDDALHDARRFGKDKERDTTPSKDSGERFKHPPSHLKLSGSEIDDDDGNADDDDDDDDNDNIDTGDDGSEEETVDDKPPDIPVIREAPDVSKSGKKTASKKEPEVKKRSKFVADVDDDLDEAELLATLRARAKERIKVDVVTPAPETKKKSGKAKKKPAEKIVVEEEEDDDDIVDVKEESNGDEDDSDQDQQDHEEEAMKKKKPKVKVFRTKGQRPEPQRAILKKSKIESEEQEEEEEEEKELDQDKGGEKSADAYERDDEDLDEKPSAHKKVKVFRTRGTEPLKVKKVETISQQTKDIDTKSCDKRHCQDDDEDDDDDEQENEDVLEEEDHGTKNAEPKKVRVFRTKGADPKHQTFRAQDRINQHADLKVHINDDDDDDDDDDEHIDVTIKRVTSSDLPIQKVAADVKRPASVPKYKKHSITNREDNRIRDKLDKAEHLLDQHEYEKGLAAFDVLLKTYPTSPRGHYGKARALDLLSEKRQSNHLLDQALKEYQLVVDSASTPSGLLLECGEHLISRYRFRGWLHSAVKVQRVLVDHFPDDTRLRTELGITFLIMNRMQDAKKVFQDILKLDPNDALAQVHHGFILKTVDQKLEQAIDFMAAGMASGEEGTQDARFFYHLGDALQRLDRQQEAYKLYEKGVEKGLFLSKYQRSLYNVKGLTSRPWWTLEQTKESEELKRIEKEWKVIRDEAVALLDKDGTSFKHESENLTNEGQWKQFTLFAKGKKNEENCKKAPKTCALVSKFEDAATCTRGQIKFSVLEGHTRVWPHCGPTNCRLRAHLGLVTPPEPRIRVADQTKQWKQGKFIVLDDSFEHQVWHEGTSSRLILIVDFWHPELTDHQRQALPPI